MEVTGADHELCVGLLVKGFLYLQDHVGSVRKIGIGKHNNVSRCFQHRRTNRTALASVLLISDDSDVRESERADRLVTSVGRTIT